LVFHSKGKKTQIEGVSEGNGLDLKKRKKYEARGVS
jgi:hypothetical protein